MTRPVQDLALAGLLLITTTFGLHCEKADEGATRLETRVNIQGQVVLAGVQGLDDISRVRIDIGQGEGGVAPGARSWWRWDLYASRRPLDETKRDGLRRCPDRKRRRHVRRCVALDPPPPGDGPSISRTCHRRASPSLPRCPAIHPRSWRSTRQDSTSTDWR